MSPVESARRVKGDTAWMVASRAEGSRCSDEFVINVPRNLDFAKIETEGGKKRTVNCRRAEAQQWRWKSSRGSYRRRGHGGDGGGTIEVGKVEGNLNLQTGGGNSSDCVRQGRHQGGERRGKRSRSFRVARRGAGEVARVVFGWTSAAER